MADQFQRTALKASLRLRKGYLTIFGVPV